MPSFDSTAASSSAASVFKNTTGAPTAHSDLFIKIEGVDGESTDAKHKGEIEVLSFSFGASNPTSLGQGAGLGAGKVSMSDLNFTMTFSKASARLFLACATGEHFKKAVITSRKAGGEQQVFMQITMSDVLVSSYSTGAAGNASIPVDNVSLAYTKIEMAVSPQSADGKVAGPTKVGFNLATNTKV